MAAHSEYTGASLNDIAFLKMKKEGGVGAIVIGSGVTENEAVSAFGYPSNFEDGNELLVVHGKRIKSPVFPDVQLMLGNSFDKGSSGGAWVNGKKNIVGLNAKVVGVPNGSDETDNMMESPVFGANSNALFKYVNAGCSGDKP